MLCNRISSLRHVYSIGDSTAYPVFANITQRTFVHDPCDTGRSQSFERDQSTKAGRMTVSQRFCGGYPVDCTTDGALNPVCAQDHVSHSICSVGEDQVELSVFRRDYADTSLVKVDRIRIDMFHKSVEESRPVPLSESDFGACNKCKTHTCAGRYCLRRAHFCTGRMCNVKRDQRTWKDGVHQGYPHVLPFQR